MRSRDFRRHQSQRALARRLSILDQGIGPPDRRDSRVLHWHLRCNCWESDEQKHTERRKRELMALKIEDLAY